MTGGKALVKALQALGVDTVFGIPGPGLLNAATGLAQAYSDSSPIMLICSENPRPDFGGGRRHLHETKSQLGVASSIVDWAKRANSAREIPDLVFEAWAAMSTGRPRPVYLEIPLDVLAEVTTFPDRLVPPTRVPLAAPSEELMIEAAHPGSPFLG